MSSNSRKCLVSSALKAIWNILGGRTEVLSPVVSVSMKQIVFIGSGGMSILGEVGGKC